MTELTPASLTSYEPTDEFVTDHTTNNAEGVMKECLACGSEADHEPGGVLCYGEADPNG